MIPLPQALELGGIDGKKHSFCTAEQLRAYGDAVRAEALEQAATIVQENAEHCRGPIRSILLANAAAIRSATKDQS